ncbi:hypothetical protein [Kribbella sp. DT2]|uniref:ATP-binding protein n=1 Tax=Kribbella sp. DT2 TaxID=3393427 RepID=UPI003CEA86B9
MENVLVGHGVSLVPVPPAKRSLHLRRLSIRGSRVNTRWDGPFEKTFEFDDGVTALITNENLRGKSTVLELITWALRGSPRRLRDDVKPWFERIQLEYSLNEVPMAVVLTKADAGFVVDVLRAETEEMLHAYLVNGAAGSVHVVASGLSENDFKAQQDQTMLTLLGLEPLTNFQKDSGSDQGRPRENTWPAYFGGLYLPPAGSEILFGDTVFAALPARILQMFCNVPLMSAQIRLSTLTKQVRQDESNQARRIAEDLAVRAGERGQLEAELADVERKLAALPSSSGRSYRTVVTELRQAEQDLDAAIAAHRSAKRTFDDAKLARQSEERRFNDDNETALAALLFQGLTPKHCPRCEQAIQAQRTVLEQSEHHCAVCTQEIDVVSDDEDDVRGEAEENVDGLEALRRAEEVAQETVKSFAEDEMRFSSRVAALTSELSTSSRSDEFTTGLGLQLEQARLTGRLESLPRGTGSLRPSDTLAVLDAATHVLNAATGAAARELFADLNAEIVALGNKFGIDNLEKVELNRQGGMKVTTAGVASSFKDVTGGERLRLRVAVVVALLRVGHRAGTGSHPGMLLLDSPGSDELTVEDEATLLRELDSLRSELPGFQVVIASAEPAAVVGVLPDENIYSSLDGGPLW